MEGDGSDFGFWIGNGRDLKLSVMEDGGVIVSDLSEIPAGHEGDVLAVNDHGNATLYRRVRFGTGFRLVDEWSVV